MKKNSPSQPKFLWIHSWGQDSLNPDGLSGWSQSRSALCQDFLNSQSCTGSRLVTFASLWANNLTEMAPSFRDFSPSWQKGDRAVWFTSLWPGWREKEETRWISHPQRPQPCRSTPARCPLLKFLHIAPPVEDQIRSLCRTFPIQTTTGSNPKSHHWTTQKPFISAPASPLSLVPASLPTADFPVATSAFSWLPKRLGPLPPQDLCSIC